MLQFYLILIIFKLAIARDPFVPVPTADRDSGVICSTSESKATFNQCLRNAPNFNNAVRRCGGSSALLGLITIPGDSNSVCNQPHSAQKQECLNFHACIGAPINMQRIVAFRQKVQEYKRGG